MFYIETQKGIQDIVANYYLDFSYSGHDMCTLPNIPQQYLNRCAKFISGIIRTSNPLSLKSLSLESGNFLSAISMQDIRDIKEQIPFYRSKKLVDEYTKDFNRISKKYPNELVEVCNKKLRKCQTIYKNDRDSILYLTDISSLDQELELLKKTKVFTKQEIQDLYSITIRLILPRYLADKIKCKTKEVTTYKTFGNKILNCAFKENTSEFVHNSILIDLLPEIARYDDLLPYAHMCKVYMNVTLKELSDIINECADYEEDYIQQVIGAIYYNLYNFVNIRESLCIDSDVEKRIVERIHKRRGN